jgi:Holliday junction resolvasome RuvABC endonuclease subunit
MIIKPPENLNFIIVDPSLRSTGVLVCRDGKISTYAIQRKEERLKVLGWYIKHFANLAKERDWDMLIVEGYAFGASSRSVTVAAEIGGIIRSCFSSYSIPIIEMTPATWKSLTGIKLKKNSVSEKREYINAVIEKYDMELSTTDEVDCYLMLVALSAISRGNFKRTQEGAGVIKEEFERLKVVF